MFIRVHLAIYSISNILYFITSTVNFMSNEFILQPSHFCKLIFQSYLHNLIHWQIIIYNLEGIILLYI